MGERLIDANALLKLRTPIYGWGVEYAVLERIMVRVYRHGTACVCRHQDNRDKGGR